MIDGKYEVERVLGRGGMGVVVAARHRDLDDRVAIKFLLPELAEQPEILARFLAEARASRKLKTEHVAKVSDVGTLEETGTPFIVMELLEGSDLASVLAKSGRLPVGLAVEYLLQACVAVAEAHSQGIVHRDLKPPNLFLTHRLDGSPCIKVLDFGIAKITGPQAPGLTTTGTRMGTVLYSAPEQLMSAKAVDHRCDIWSLGVTLYELVTGHLPFDGDDFAGLVGAILTLPHKPVHERRGDVPTALIALVDRTLAKDRDARPQSVLELAEGLAPFGAGDSQRSLQAIRRLLGSTRAAAGRVAATVADTAVEVARSRTEPMPGPAVATSLAQVVTTEPLSAGPPDRDRRTVLVGTATLGVLTLVAGVAWLTQRGASEPMSTSPAATEASIEGPAVEPPPADSIARPAILEASSEPATRPPPRAPIAPPAVSQKPAPKEPPEEPAPKGPMTDQERFIAICRGKLPAIDAQTERMIRQMEKSASPEHRAQAAEARQRIKAEKKAMCDQLRAAGLL